MALNLENGDGTIRRTTRKWFTRAAVALGVAAAAAPFVPLHNEDVVNAPLKNPALVAKAPERHLDIYAPMEPVIMKQAAKKHVGPTANQERTLDLVVKGLEAERPSVNRTATAPKHTHG